MLSLLARIFRTEDSIEDMRSANVRFVAPASYSGKNEKEMSQASAVNTAMAISLVRTCFPDAVLLLSGCSHPYKGAEIHERLLKEALCRKADTSFIYVGDIINSIDEVEKWNEAMSGCRGDLVIVTCDFHSPSERMLGWRLIKGRRVLIRTNSYRYEVEKDHPTPDQRTWWRWLPCSIVRLIAVTFLPLDMLRNVRHKGKHE